MTVADTVAGTSRSITSVRLFDKNGTLFCSGALDSNSRLRCANDAGLFTVDGNHVVTVEAEGFKRVRREVKIDADAKLAMPLELETDKAEAKPDDHKVAEKPDDGKKPDDGRKPDDGKVAVT